MDSDDTPLGDRCDVAHACRIRRDCGCRFNKPDRRDPLRLGGREAEPGLHLIAAGSLIGFSAYIWLLGVVPTARVSTYAYVNPVVAVLIGWAVAGEPLNVRTLLATAAIVAAVALIITHRPSPGAMAPETEDLPTT